MTWLRYTHDYSHGRVYCPVSKYEYMCWYNGIPCTGWGGHGASVKYYKGKYDYLTVHLPYGGSGAIPCTPLGWRLL